MIINHQYRFCFFAIPRTASKALSQALIDQLGSEEILRMHASYPEFMEQASAKERRYFTFTTVRNPLDSIVSAYFKKKNDHNGRFSRGTFKEGRPIGKRAMTEYRFIVDNDADFATYFAHFYQEEYRIPRHEKTASKVDHILKFERLAEDVQQLCTQQDWPPVSIPLKNKTEGKTASFLDYYTPQIIPQAKRVVGPLMSDWGYDFPAEWS